MGFRRILVVDDSPVARKIVSEIVRSIEGVSDVVTASNGRLALERLAQDRFELVILDVEMPELDGIATLRTIRARYPKLPVLMFSALTERAGTLTLEALALGARDYFTKPTGLGAQAITLEQLREQLIRKIEGILPADATEQRATREPLPSAPGSTPIAERRMPNVPIEILAIGASTGGPLAITEILTRFPGDLGVPIVIVQHMPPFFTQLFSKRLDELCELRVLEAAAGAELLPGTVWVAPGDFHLRVHRSDGKVYLETNQEQPENSCRPSVDVLFRSVAAVYGPAALGLVLTGMGEDGMRGAHRIRERGGLVVAQDQPTSVVWGMPGAVVQARAADRVVPLDRMSDVILELLASRRSSTSQAGTSTGGAR